ncbi:hypothetical protein AB0D11_02180 [Streptomyces monashensis]|uniref:hypothetical protein n=1 Tax=Streptomyces monashensis TaxID=1678012 RepID=UPI0033CF7A21
MNTAIVIGYATVFLALVFVIWRHMPRTPDAEQQRVGADNRYVAPNDPRLPAGLDRRLDDYAALDPDLAPVFAPGLDRLRRAIRDEQQKGDPA